MNAHAERFNRTAQEECIHFHDDLPAQDLHAFNDQLLACIQRYNGDRPHLSLGYFMFERGKHATTNYWRGELVPLNTEVTLVSVRGKKMVLDMDGVKVTFVNARKHTQRGTAKIASELLSPTKIPLERLPEELREDILSGVMRLGMTKEQVLMTRGYPPRHKTSSIKANIWVYWSNKFVKRSLVFRKGKLTQGRGLY